MYQLPKYRYYTFRKQWSYNALAITDCRLLFASLHDSVVINKCVHFAFNCKSVAS